MDILDFLKSPAGYAAQNRNIPSALKATAQKLC